MRKCNSYSCIHEPIKIQNKKNDFFIDFEKTPRIKPNSTHISTNIHIDEEPVSYERNQLFRDFKNELLLYNIRKEHKDGTRVRANSIFCESIDLEESSKTNHYTTLHIDELRYNPNTASVAFTKFINNLFENPEGRMTNLQRISIILYSCFETYRTIISSFLTVFVPQNCGGYSCTILENAIPKDDIEVAAISINTFMAFYFCALFTIESIREKVVKKYLTTDKSCATDKDYLEEMLAKMKPNERREVLKLNAVYRIFAQVLLIFFFVNASISCVVIRKNYLNNTTATVFITNMLFTINRIHKSLKITSSGEYNIYSTYRTDNLIYNRYRGTVTHARPAGIAFPYVYEYIRKHSKCDQVSSYSSDMA